MKTEAEAEKACGVLHGHPFTVCHSTVMQRQLYKNISMLFLFPVKDGKLSTGVNATFNAWLVFNNLKLPYKTIV